MGKALEGDWEYRSEGCDPVKLTVKNIEGGFNLVQFNCTKKETKDNQELEADLKAFLEKGISNITKEGKILKITAGGVQREFSHDDMLQKQEEEKQKKLAEPKLASESSGRFG